MKKVSEYWVAQNTGWSGEVSWFNNHGTDHPWYHHFNKESAIKDAKVHKKNLPDSKHRVVHRVVYEEILDI